ncbi:hypothetical protein J2X45_003905 [Caulobacter sp. BE264]|uniref:hypothetical protein n=1 Tax=Caulobacter sp. BE264 TaxID=2817724 RepID=UPI00286662A7|nr:hypothetical protein [Caulobacter sp. BE264]MDR7232795.1 hypothetical protein [Caulobacter sp. BE264]
MTKDDYTEIQGRIVALELMMRGVWTGLAARAPSGELERNRVAALDTMRLLNPDGDTYREEVLMVAAEHIDQHFQAIANRLRSAGFEP